jgi:hypothetical protein
LFDAKLDVDLWMYTVLIAGEHAVSLTSTNNALVLAAPDVHSAASHGVGNARAALPPADHLDVAERTDLFSLRREVCRKEWNYNERSSNVPLSCHYQPPRASTRFHRQGKG